MRSTPRCRCRGGNSVGQIAPGNQMAVKARVIGGRLATDDFIVILANSLCLSASVWDPGNQSYRS